VLAYIASVGLDPGGIATTGEGRLRFTLRPLSPDGVRLIKDVDRALPALTLGERELEICVAEGGELEHVLSSLAANWSQLVEVEVCPVRERLRPVTEMRRP
jgi:hypothetical protein